VTDEKLQTALFQRMNLEKKKKKESDASQGIETTTTTTTTTTTITGGVFVMEVESESPALEAGIWPLEMKEGKVEIGDRIVAVNGNRIDTPGDLKKEIQCRVVGEKVTITVENAFGERRVVYTTLVEKP
jgi:Periplasmic protease